MSDDRHKWTYCACVWVNNADGSSSCPWTNKTCPRWPHKVYRPADQSLPEMLPSEKEPA